MNDGETRGSFVSNSILDMKRRSKFLRILLLAALLSAQIARAGSFSFATDILPILTKTGCNTGECHGAATGQGGLKLSLLGYDPQADYEHITREFSGRRIDLGKPEHSLFLRKPTKQVKHKGGRVIRQNSPDYEAMLRWIRDGAPEGDRNLVVTGIAAEPADIKLPSPNATAAIKVFATHSDGSRRDVTDRALYTSNDDGLAEVDEGGNVTVLTRGVTSVMIRYGGQVAAARVGVPLQPKTDKPIRFATANFVDRAVAAELTRWHIPPAALCEQSEFFRRAHLDLIGRLPEPDAVKNFLQTKDTPAHRQQVIERLLQRDAFVDLWTMRLGDLLLISSKKQGPEGSKTYHTWLRQQLAANTPIDGLARSLLTASGNIAEVGPANFYKMTSDPRDTGEFVSRTFLGVRVACARCHNHPFDRWSMKDYYQFAAFFAHTASEGNRIVLKNRGEVRHPKSKKIAQPKPLGGTAAQPLTDDRRTGLAAWLTAPDNPYFARAFVNRIWKHLIGRGIIEPVDDVRVTNPPSNPALLDALAADFVKHGYDFRHLIQTITTSRTYQLASRVNEVNRNDERFFSHAYLKPISAQVLADAITQATGRPDDFGADLDVQWATQLHDPQIESYTLDVFGRCPRTDSCEAPENFGGGLTQALHFINSTVVNGKLRNGAIRKLVSDHQTDRQRIGAVYLRTLSRPPSETESVHWEQLAAQAESKIEFYEDLTWALINSREFAFNH
jgi:hypothetical protein